MVCLSGIGGLCGPSLSFSTGPEYRWTACRCSTSSATCACTRLWAYTLPTTFLRVFYSATEAGVWSLIVYWAVGFAPEFSRCARVSCKTLDSVRILQ